jgi:hypothetical protein
LRVGISHHRIFVESTKDEKYPIISRELTY